jgi:hypothetical protein
MFGDLTCAQCDEAIAGKPLYMDGWFYCGQTCFRAHLKAFREALDAKKGGQHA